MHNVLYTCISLEQLQPVPPPGPQKETLLKYPDPRFTINPATSPPYKWICHLEMKHDKRYMGTGFEVNATTKPEKKVILTCAHNLYTHGKYASEVIITNGSQQQILADSSQLWVPKEYIDYSKREMEKEANDYDFGVIFVEGNSGKGFGWSCSVADDQLMNTLISVCGYTGDGELVISGGPITEVSERMLYYTASTGPGQSGSPVYTWINEKWTVVGVHCFGYDKKNSCVRFQNEFLRSILNEKELELQPQDFCKD